MEKMVTGNEMETEQPGRLSVSRMKWPAASNPASGSSMVGAETDHWICNTALTTGFATRQSQTNWNEAALVV